MHHLIRIILLLLSRLSIIILLFLFSYNYFLNFFLWLYNLCSIVVIIIIYILLWLQIVVVIIIISYLLCWWLQCIIITTHHCYLLLLVQIILVKTLILKCCCRFLRAIFINNDSRYLRRNLNGGGTSIGISFLDNFLYDSFLHDFLLLDFAWNFLKVLGAAIYFTSRASSWYLLRHRLIHVFCCFWQISYIRIFKRYRFNNRCSLLVHSRWKIL